MDINNIVEQITFIKEKLSELQDELEKITVEGTDSENMITAIISGKGKIMDYQFNLTQMEGINRDKLIKAAIEATNNGLLAARELEASRKKAIVGDFNIPGMPDLF